jgi:hypothetical protein
MTAGDASGSRRRLHKPLLFLGGGCALLALVFALPFDGPRLLAAIGVCSGLFLLERTIGDWLADLAGARFASLLFAILLGAGGWYSLGTVKGRNATAAFLSRGSGRSLPIEPAVVSPADPARPSAQLPAPHLIAPSPRSAAGGGPSSGVPGSQRLSTGVPPATGVLSQAEPRPASAMTTVRFTVTPSVVETGAPVLLAAEVHSGGAMVAGGTVVFASDSGVLATASVSAGHAESAVSNLPVGKHSVGARYLGSGRFRASSSEVVDVTVLEAPR